MPPGPSPPHHGIIEGRISIVQEDRFRLIDDSGRGFLFVTRKRVASIDELERLRDAGQRVSVEYDGVPDLGALAQRVRTA